jgi:nucleoside 2-deoxyribosyltransferase
MRHKIYLSGPLFSQGEIDWGRCVKSFLEESFVNVEIMWPHEIVSDVAKRTFHANLDAMKDCDLMVAILDGPQVDDGTAWEVGYFFSQGKRIIGIRTDFRRAGESNASIVNLMVEFSCQAVVTSLEELASWLERFLD